MEQERLKAHQNGVMQRVMIGKLNRTGESEPQLEYPQLYEAFVQLSQSGAFPTLGAQIEAAAVVLSRQRAPRG